MNQSINHLNLFFQILDSYIYFVRQKQLIEDKDDAIPQIMEMVEAKLEEGQEGEEEKKVAANYKNRWAEIKGKYQWWGI